MYLTTYRRKIYISLYEGDEPETVEISLINGKNDYDFVAQIGSEVVYSDDLVITNTSH